MALIACNECGAEVSTSANACPKCGAKVPRTKWWLWIPLVLVAAFFAFPYLASTPAQRAANSARADCERVFQRGRGCDQVYDDVLRRESPVRESPVREAPIDRALVEATAKARAAEEVAYRKECEQSLASRKADYQRLMRSRQFWSASLVLRRCSELLDDPALKALVADAEKRQYIMEIESRATTQEVRDQAIRALLRDYPDIGAKYANRLEK
jgi:hypothetical protein